MIARALLLRLLSFSVANTPTSTFRSYFARTLLFPSCTICSRSSPILGCNHVVLDFRSSQTACTLEDQKARVHHLCSFRARKNCTRLVLCTYPCMPRYWRWMCNNCCPRMTPRWRSHPTNHFATARISPREKKMEYSPRRSCPAIPALCCSGGHGSTLAAPNILAGGRWTTCLLFSGKGGCSIDSND